MAEADAQSLDSRIGDRRSRSTPATTCGSSTSPTASRRAPRSGANANPPIGECCSPAPNVLEFDRVRRAGRTLGRTRRGLRLAGSESRARASIAEGNVWIGGSGGADTRILKFSRDGKFVAQFGKAAPVAAGAGAGARRRTPRTRVSRRPSAARAGAAVAVVAADAVGAGRRRRCRRTAEARTASAAPAAFSFDANANEVFVADGYRNHRVAVVDMTTGAIKRFWGAYGNKPDDADTAKYTPGGHGAKAVRRAGALRDAVERRHGLRLRPQNDRIQVFKKDGTFVKEKVDRAEDARHGLGVGHRVLARPAAEIHLRRRRMNMKVHILDRQSLEELTSFGDGGRQPGQFYAVHSVATDSKGNLYTTETYEGKRVQKFNFKGVGARRPQRTRACSGRARAKP